MKIYKLIILSLTFGWIISCAPQEQSEQVTTPSDVMSNHDHTEHEGHNHGEMGHPDRDHEETEGAHEEGAIHLTRDQIKTVGIEFGDFKEIKINDYIPATGGLGLPPKSYSSVSAKAEGFIKNCGKFVEGSFVKKGQIIAHLENPELIQRQQEYLEVQAELTFLNQELARQRQLVNANAGVQRDLQKLEADVMKKTARIKGIAKQLSYLGISVEQLTPDNIRERIAIVAPLTGHVTSINLHDGMYVTPQMVLMDIADDHHLHLELDVFEKDIAGLKEEQKITYTAPALGKEVYEGEVHVIGKEFNPENKTLRVHGHLVGKHPKFIKDLFVDAKIWLDNQSVPALPDDAIIREGVASYIYAANPNISGEEVEFNKIMVLPGATSKGYTSVKLVDAVPTGMKIVISGAYYVYAQSQAGELEHEH